MGFSSRQQTNPKAHFSWVFPDIETAGAIRDNGRGSSAIDHMDRRTFLRRASGIAAGTLGGALPGVLLPACTSAAAPTIDRRALVDRHAPVVRGVDSFSVLSVGNGDFAFTADLTGLQTFPDAYRDVPLATQATWAWHTLPNPNGYRLEDAMSPFEVDGRSVTYPDRQGSPAGAWLRQNPHRLSLARIGFALWDRVPLLEKSLPWYRSILPAVQATARRQGYAGARWPKMVGPDGRESPSTVGVFLIWQQPHPIYWPSSSIAPAMSRRTELQLGTVRRRTEHPLGRSVAEPSFSSVSTGYISRHLLRDCVIHGELREVGRRQLTICARAAADSRAGAASSAHDIQSDVRARLFVKANRRGATFVPKRDSAGRKNTAST